MRNFILIIFLLSSAKLWASFNPKDDRVYKFSNECIKLLPLDNDSVSGKHRLLRFQYISKDTHQVAQLKDTLLICEGTNIINGIDTILYFVIDTNSLSVDSAYIYVTSIVQKISNSVYPGDVNHDGQVSYEDFLFWADRFGTKVTKRYEKSDAWRPYAMPLNEWKDTTAFSTKTFLADADGDGQVSLNDVLPIINNYGKTHSFGDQLKYDSITNFAYPKIPFRVLVSKSKIFLGDNLNIDLWVGNTSQPLQEISGVGYLLNTYVLEKGEKKKIDLSPEFLPYDSWLKFGGILDFSLFSNIDTGMYYGVQTLTGRKKAEGGGSVGQVRIIVDDLIIQNLKAGNNIVFELAGARAVGSDKNKFLSTQLTSDTLKADQLMSINQTISEGLKIHMDHTSIHIVNPWANKNEVFNYHIQNMMGVNVRKITSDGNLIEIDFEDQPVGCYIIHVVSHNKTIYTLKIVKD